MTRRQKLWAAALACALIATSPAYADNYVVKDGNGSFLTMAAKLVAGILHPFHIAEGLNSSTGAPQAATVDNATGGLNVNVVGGSGGGGGAITAASGAYAAGSLAAGAAVDGWNLTLGTKADSAYAGSGSASLIAIGKGLYALGAGAIPAGSNVIGGVTLSGTLPGYAATPTFNLGTSPSIGSVGSAAPSAATLLGLKDSSGNGQAAAQAPGTTGVAQVGGVNLATAATPTIQAAAYASGNCVGGFNAITVSQFNGQSGFLTNVRLTSIGGLTAAITVYLFDSNPSSSTCTDKSTFTLNAADVDKLIAEPFALTPAAAVGTTTTFAGNPNMGRPFVAGGSSSSGVKTIYYALVAGGAMTPASTSDLHLRVGTAY